MDTRITRIAMIGSRELDQFSPEVLGTFRDAALAAARYGHIIRTGAAVGSDQFAAETSLEAEGIVELVLPWRSYEQPWYERMRVRHGSRLIIDAIYGDGDLYPDWTQSVHAHHPAADRLTRGPFALHARNYGIIEPCDFVIALPSLTKPGGGGTGQGIRVARALGKQLFVLTDPAQLRAFQSRLRGE